MSWLTQTGDTVGKTLTTVVPVVWEYNDLSHMSRRRQDGFGSVRETYQMKDFRRKRGGEEENVRDRETGLRPPTRRSPGTGLVRKREKYLVEWVRFKKIVEIRLFSV